MKPTQSIAIAWAAFYSHAGTLERSEDSSGSQVFALIYKDLSSIPGTHLFKNPDIVVPTYNPSIRELETDESLWLTSQLD